jgi:two-component system cell cycle response regulator
MKILLTEDSAVYRHMLCTQLTEWKYSVEAVADAESALPIISAAAAPMLLLTDWELPGMSGLDLISAVRRLCLKHYVYAIVLTARKDKADLVTALDAGADDYLVKPFHEEELRARLQVATRTLALHEELVHANERLECLASEDALTDLLNRRALMTEFRRERLRAQREQSLITLVMCDIDHFKQVNDSHGHTVGDEVLKLVARALQSSSRGSDLVARVGGDEFLLVLPDSDVVGSVTLVQRVRQRLKERAELYGVLISLSFGIAAIDLEQSEQAALEKVDAALYAAKREGRDRHFVALPTYPDRKDMICALTR